MGKALPALLSRGPSRILGAFVLGFLGACDDFLDLDLDPDGEPTNEVDLSALVVSGGALVPAFDERITSYAVDVGALTDSTMVTATTEARRATLEIDGLPAVSGQPFGPIALATGVNVITVAVTGFDGITVQTYTLTVERAPLRAERAAVAPVTVTLAPAAPAHTSDARASPGTVTTAGVRSGDSPAPRGMVHGVGRALGVVVVFHRPGVVWRPVATVSISQAEEASAAFDPAGLVESARELDGDVLLVAAAIRSGDVARTGGQASSPTAAAVAHRCWMRRAGTWRRISQLPASVGAAPLQGASPGRAPPALR